MTTGFGIFIYVVGVILIISGFFTNIIVSDVSAIVILGSLYAKKTFHLHDAYCILIGVALVMVFLGLLMIHKVLTYIISFAMSIGWGYFLYLLFTHDGWFDHTWRVIISVVLGFIWIGMHIARAEELGEPILQSRSKKSTPMGNYFNDLAINDKEPVAEPVVSQNDSELKDANLDELFESETFKKKYIEYLSRQGDVNEQ